MNRSDYAAAIAKVHATWPADAALELLELPAGEIMAVLALVYYFAARPADVAELAQLAELDERIVDEPRRAHGAPMPPETVALLRRWGLPLPASYQLTLEHDVEHADGFDSEAVA